MVGGTASSGVSRERHYSSVKAQVATGSLCALGFGLDHFCSPLLGLESFTTASALTVSFVLCTMASVAAKAGVTIHRRREEAKVFENYEAGERSNRTATPSINQLLLSFG